ncbi:MAG: hypothetical protein ACI4SM_02165 [Candidatus Gastranaerophilaceae bacterium]
MKKFALILLVLFTTQITVFADDLTTVKGLFNQYVKAANTYNPSLLNYYSPNAKIIRQVVKPNGELVNATTNMQTYTKQMKISQGTAKVRHYTNKYSNISATQTNRGVKISALRQPMKESYWLKTYQIWQKQSNGSWKIVEEMMQTKEQIFLHYADK